MSFISKMGLVGIFPFLLLLFFTTKADPMDKEAKNVLGTELKICCTDPMTGFYRDGYCNTGYDDVGTHVVCAIMSQEFLDYTLKQGNDLCTARPEYRFPGLKAGDKWCLCAVRWKEAHVAGVAPKLDLERTHSKALEIIDLETLKKYHSPLQEK